MKKRSLTLVLSVLLIAAVAVGGTLAYLLATDGPVVNTFTYGDINIEINESDADGDNNTKANNYKMIPGNKIAKDPYVVVKANSEACWLFVEIIESENFDDYLTYTVRSEWTPLEGNIYYRSVAATTNAATENFYVLANGEGDFANGFVTVNSDVDKADMEALKTGAAPQLTFNAYAVQKDNLTVEQAWNVAKGLNPDGTTVQP